MKLKIYYFLFFINIIIVTSVAQKPITVDDAVAIALKSNYDILVARNDADIDKINNTAGNAGMLPSLALNGSDNFSNYNSRVEQTGGAVLTNPNARTNALSANVALNWTLFDGGKMFVTKNKLSEIEALG